MLIHVDGGKGEKKGNSSTVIDFKLVKIKHYFTNVHNYLFDLN